MHLECIDCGKKYDFSTVANTCTCDGLLEIKYDFSAIHFSLEALSAIAPHVWKYRELLPISGVPISLMEGGTPLYRCKRLERECGIKELYVKHEGMNPTGSFKDRGMTVGVSRAAELGFKTVACASTGNTAASMAIYAAKAGMAAVVLLPRGHVALGKVAQALMHGAKVLSLRGNFDDALVLIQRLCSEKGFYLLNSVNPYRLEGQKTIAFEMVDQLMALGSQSVPDRVIVPVGNAGNISAIYKGFREFRELNVIDSMPMMTGIQASRAAPIVDAFQQGLAEIRPVTKPQTVATAIRIGNPINAPKALRAIRESGGLAESVTDEEILKAQKDLARLEGIGVEPASAASIAGLRKLIDQGTIDRDEIVACVATGHLLKDPEVVLKASRPPIEVEADLEALYAALTEVEPVLTH
ncbi:MAG TPA: threonine synthase [Candidatus Bathyarchaeia archaeon]|nr:threonine synthase [Candidatus Bathyarchaeia archaeon]